MAIEIYGIAYSSPIIIWQLISQQKYAPILLINNSISHVRQDVDAQLKKNTSKTPVVLAGSLEIAQLVQKNYADLKYKLVLFDCPPLLNPPVNPLLKWLDCDLQAAGAWQVAKIKPEDFMDLLDTLDVLSQEGKDYITSVKRHGNSNRLDEIKKFSDSIPKYYKDILATLDSAQNKSPIKEMKQRRSVKDNLTSLLSAALTNILESKDVLTKLVLDYQISLVTKREFLSKLTHLVSDETVKKEFLTIRKWMDSKSGFLLQEAFFDFAFNHERRSWQTITEHHKKASEDDLQLLIAHFDMKKTLQVFSDKVHLYTELPSDKVPVDTNQLRCKPLGELLNV